MVFKSHFALLSNNLYRSLVVCILALLFLIMPEARADSIDGTWCRAQDQKMMTISGSQLIIDRFVSTGQYSRHSFVADWPNPSQNDPDAGSRVHMRLVDEMNLHLMKVRPNGENTPKESWHRCQPVT